MAFRKYTDEFIASTTAMLVAEGYAEDANRAVNIVYGYLKSHGKAVSKTTLHRWASGNGNSHIPNLVDSKKDDLADIFEDVARQYLEQSLRLEVIEETRGKDAVITAATAVDKMRLLRDLPTEIVAVLPAVNRMFMALTELNRNPVDEMNALAELLERKLDDGRVH